MWIHNYHDLLKIKRLSLWYSSNVLKNFLWYDGPLKFYEWMQRPALIWHRLNQPKPTFLAFPYCDSTAKKSWLVPTSSSFQEKMMSLLEEIFRIFKVEWLGHLLL